MQIISQDIFDRAQQIIAQRATHYDKQKSAPRTTVGRALLSGNIYCGHCGGRIFPSTARKSHHPPADGLSPESIPIYKCYNCTQHKAICDGPCSYSAYKVDDVIREMLQEVFAKAKGVRESDLVDRRYADQMNELTVQLKKAKTDYSKKSKLKEWVRSGVYETLTNDAFMVG